MKLCIAEKSKVAEMIAAILGANERHDGYFEGNGYRVSWTVGHLCCLMEPDDYRKDWKMWSLSALPMLPQKYDIKLIEDTGHKHQFKVLERLIGEADEVINCGDAGQEGELIQRWVMKKAGIKCPVLRLWNSSLTDEAIREAFRNLKPEKEYDGLYYAGLARAIGDWILGMNATRLYTLKYSRPGTVLSIGRVQTPTLALIVSRQKEIAEFVPKDSWELQTVYRDVTFVHTGDRFETEKAGLDVVEEIRPELFVIDDVSKKKGRESPPRLFDLTSLQVECNKRFAWTAETTLKLIQSLYEKKLTTYPRVDTTYLPDDVYPKIAPTLKAMTPYGQYTAPILAGKIPKSKKVFDNAKITDHHAIIPTGQSPLGIEGDEKKLYHLIAMRFISAFYPDCQFEATTVLGHAGKYQFKATGKVILSPGWRALQPQKTNDSQEENNAVLPVFSSGESGSHAPQLAKKTSQPPKYYDDGTLLRAMQTAGRNIEDDEIREAMKENGIGRPSTRDAIIETLVRRKYIYRQRKNILATQAGIDLIDTINEELLKSAKLTGHWEHKLRRIERGDYSPALFIREINELITNIVHNVLSDNSHRRIVVDQEEKKIEQAKPETKEKKPRAPRIKSIEEIPCPVCGKGHVVKGRTAFGCSEYASGCTFRLMFTDCPPDTTPGALRKKLYPSKKK